MCTLAVRPALPEDETFLYELYRAVRGPAFDPAPIAPEQKEYLLRLQFEAQLSSYTEQFPNSRYRIVLLDGTPCGRLWVVPGEHNFHLVDIAMHPSVQKKGIGTILIKRLQEEAQRLSLPIKSTVDRFNPGSMRFHQRLGFGIAREDAGQYYMEWRPAPPAG